MAKSTRPAGAGKTARAIDDAAIRKLSASLGEVVHTHTSRIPQGAVVAGAVTDPATLAPDPVSLPYVCGATTLGNYRLASSVPIGLAMALTNDAGLPECASRLDLALAGNTKELIEAGLTKRTARALCHAAAQLQARAPAEPLPDQPVLFFEADGEEVAVTPVTPVVVLQQINARSRLVVGGRYASRTTLRVRQGGANPQNIASYVAASPPRDSDAASRNINARHGHYLALRGRFPLGVRSGPERSLARMVAAATLCAGGMLARAEAQSLARRVTTAFLLPGAAMRPANVREAELRHAGLIAEQYLEPLLVARAWLAGRSNTGYALGRLSSAEHAWLLGASLSRDNVGLLAEAMAADVAKRVSQLAKIVLPPVTFQALVDAIAARLR
jgi:hypothetical protein